jgi:endonuclease/exonuclease/phosphatase family metal-dependent hydrolase
MWTNVYLLLCGSLAVLGSNMTPPSVWLGSSPICDAQPIDCDLFDLTYLQSSAKGDGKMCFTGKKVLCQVRTVDAPLMLAVQKSDPDQFQILTFNVFQRPFIVSHDGQYIRTCHIPRTIVNTLPELDVVVFQEAFLGGCNKEMSMRETMSYYGFPYNTPTVGALTHERDYVSKTFTVTNGGVFLVSRWEILEHQSFVYTNFTFMTADHVARKGVMYAKIRKGNDTIYHVFTTHMQAQDGPQEDDTRLKQAGEFSDFIKQMNIPAEERIIIAGDFNADRWNNSGHVEKIRETLQSTIPPTRGSMDATYDPRINDVVEPGATPQWIDYVMYSNEHRQPREAYMEGIYLHTETPIRYCSHAPLYPFYVPPYSSFCFGVHTTRYLSDHFPVLGVFHF